MAFSKETRQNSHEFPKFPTQGTRQRSLQLKRRLVVTPPEEEEDTARDDDASAASASMYFSRASVRSSFAMASFSDAPELETIQDLPPGLRRSREVFFPTTLSVK